MPGISIGYGSTVSSRYGRSGHLDRLWEHSLYACAPERRRGNHRAVTVFSMYAAASLYCARSRFQISSKTEAGNE
uniref:Uncharacterized protein n=1 Tax=Arundo donax TaxID=35708 RepID=A0A0A8Y699_ARUDO